MAPLIGNDVFSKTIGNDEEQDDVEDTHQQEAQNEDAVDRHKSTVARAANAEAALSGKNYEERLADLVGITVFTYCVFIQRMKPKTNTVVLSL